MQIMLEICCSVMTTRADTDKSVSHPYGRAYTLYSNNVIILTTYVQIAMLNKRIENAEVRNVSSQVQQSENEKTIRRLVAELQEQRNKTPAPKHDPDVEDLSKKIATMDCEYRKLECNVKR